MARPDPLGGFLNLVLVLICLGMIWVDAVLGGIFTFSIIIIFMVMRFGYFPPPSSR